MNNVFQLHSRHSYADVVGTLLAVPDRISKNRKGDNLYECFNVSLEITDASQAFFYQRDASLSYLEKELELYLSGSRDLADAVKCSKFWEKCSDDGKTINSNYGAMLFHDCNSSGNTQFGYALEALRNNLASKKAVMVLHDTEHGHISNDNPCTMFVHFYTTEQESTGPIKEAKTALHMRVVMRSNDIWFGATYDMPFFAVVWEVMRRRLQDHYNRPITTGTYTHQALNLHMYERNVTPWRECVRHNNKERHWEQQQYEYIRIMYRYVERFYELSKANMKRNTEIMQQAWQVSQESKCLKKHCGCVIVHPEHDVVGVGYGGRAHGDVCSTCARDAGEVFHGDGCWSVHAEMRAIRQAAQNARYLNIGDEETERFFNECTAYVTHGPCDACLKLLDFYGVRKVFYDKPYKTNYGHWPRMAILRLQMPE